MSGSDNSKSTGNKVIIAEGALDTSQNQIVVLNMDQSKGTAKKEKKKCC